MPEPAPIIEMHGITKRFGGVTAVEDVSLSIGERQLLGFIGPNGAGKTTTFNMIAGAMEPTEGRIVFDGPPQDLTSGAARDIYGAGADFSEAATSTEIETLDRLKQSA